MKKPNYRIYDQTDGGVTEAIYAESLEDAIEQGREWIENGDWSGCGGHEDSTEGAFKVTKTIRLDCFVREITYRTPRPSLSGTEKCRIADLLKLDTAPDLIRDVDYDDMDRSQLESLCDYLESDDSSVDDTDRELDQDIARQIIAFLCEEDEIDDEATDDNVAHDCSGTYSDDEPECPVEEGWDFVSTAAADMGDFGCHSHGGTAMTHYEVCRNTGIYRDTYDPGSQRNPDAPLEVETYRERDEESEKFIKDYHEDDGWIPDWLAEYLDCPPTTRMTAKEAREWILQHDDADEPDDEELEHAFAATLSRRPTSSDREEGLWSRLCADFK